MRDSLLCALALLFPVTALSVTTRGGGGIEVPSPTHAEPLATIGEEGSYVFTTGAVGFLRIDVCGPRTFRVRWSPSRIEDQPSVALSRIGKSLWVTPSSLLESRDAFKVRTSDAEARVSRSGPLRVDFYDRATGLPMCLGGGIYYDSEYRPEEDPTYKSHPRNLPPPRGYRIREVKRSPLGEAYLGLGDWGGPLNRRGSSLQFWNDDAWGWSELRNPKYTTMPVYHAIFPGSPSHRYTLFLHNSSRSMFDMASTSPDSLWFQVSAGDLDYFIVVGGGDSLVTAMGELSALTGRSALLPKWAYGYHLSKFTYTQEEIEQAMEAHRARRVPVSAVFIDMDYMDQGPSVTDREWHLVQFKWGPAYPRPGDLVRLLRANGIASVLMVEPFLTDEDPKFALAESSGWFLRNPDGTPCLMDIWCAERVGWLDYTSPAASSWWRGELAGFLGEFALSGVWNDLNETADRGRIPLDAVYDMGLGFPATPPEKTRLHQVMKSLYALYNARVSYDAQRVVAPSRRPYVLSRGAFPGLQRWAASWSGDNVSTPEHLRCNIRVGTSMGVSGLSNYGHDVGGFSGNPTHEVMERWQEWSVFSPSMRNHYSKESSPRELYRFPPETARRLEGTILQRYYLLPTLYSLARAATSTGWPINAPVPAVFPSDPVTYYASESDIMLGQSVLAAPVVIPGDSTRSVYLPEVEGGWFSLWDEARFSPGWHEVPAPLGRSPAFVRAGGFVAVDPRPLSPTRPWGEGVLEWRDLEIHAWPGSPGHFRLYDDDGQTCLDYPDGRRLTVSISGSQAGRRWVLWLSSDAPLGDRELTLVLRGLRSSPRSVRVNGVPPSLSWGADAARVVLRSPDRPLSHVVEVELPPLLPAQPSSVGQPPLLRGR